MSLISRRSFVKTSTASVTLSCAHHSIAQTNPTHPLETHVPCRQITFPPGFHWFGYYDKREFDSTNTCVLSNRVGFEGRSPTPDDAIDVGYIDLKRNDTWVPLGTSRAWGWQQGCMLQWVGTTGKTVLWNDRDGDRFISRLLNVETGHQKTLPMPIYTVAPDGSFGLSADFRRINNLRPGYGYSGLADPYVHDRAPDASGIWKIDFKTGETHLILSLAQVAAIPWPDGKRHTSAWHYFNHLLINPTGNRFVFLHRYRPVFHPQTLRFEGGFVTRMLSANVDGSDLFVLDPSGHTSHFIWDDATHVTMWTKPTDNPAGFYQMTDRTDQVVPVGSGVMTANGHNTNLPAPYQNWILNDTYPSRNGRRQTVYLYNRSTQKKILLGHFPSPAQYSGEWRCDTHPRSSNNGHFIVIDSPHSGGRQLHLLDIRAVIQ